MQLFSYSKLLAFQAFLLTEKQKDFQALLDEGKLIAKVALQAVVDGADTTLCSLVSGVVLRCDSWLQFSGFPKEVQTTLVDLPFENHKLFSYKMDKSLHFPKDTFATLQSPGIYTPSPTHRQQQSS